MTSTWTAGVVRHGNAPAEPSPTPLGWMTITCQIEGDHWSEPLRSAVLYATPAEHQASVTRRRKGRNLAFISGGVEFDSYAPGCAPQEDMQGNRTRITWEQS